MLPADGARCAPSVRSCRGGRAAHRDHAPRDRARNADRLGARLDAGRPARRRDSRRPSGHRGRVHALPPEPRLMPEGVWDTPRAIPSRRLPALAGTAVVVFALPVFLVTELPLAAWGIAAGLWIAYQVIGLLLERAALGMDNLALAGVVAVGRITRAAGLVTILIVVAVSDSDLGLPAAIVYALAFTVEFGMSLVAYFGGEART